MGRLSTEILTMKLILNTGEEVIESIAGERPNDTKKREKIELDLKSLREILRVIEEYRNRSQ